MRKFKVQYYQNEIYEVIQISDHSHMDGIGTFEEYQKRSLYATEEQVFKGSLSDCEAWIRLHEMGYMD